MKAGRRCANPQCGRPLKPHEKRCHGWCPACYRRWNNGGRPADGPPAPREANREYMAIAKAARVAQAHALAALGLDACAVARHLNLGHSTVRRYLKTSPPEGAAVVSDSLRTGAEILYSSAAHTDAGQASPPDVEYRNGRVPADWEQEIFADAIRSARVRDAQMLAGVAMRKVA